MSILRLLLCLHFIFAHFIFIKMGKFQNWANIYKFDCYFKVEKLTLDQFKTGQNHFPIHQGNNNIVRRKISQYTTFNKWKNFSFVFVKSSLALIVQRKQVYVNICTVIPQNEVYHLNYQLLINIHPSTVIDELHRWRWTFGEHAFHYIVLCFESRQILTFSESLWLEMDEGKPKHYGSGCSEIWL